MILSLFKNLFYQITRSFLPLMIEMIFEVGCMGLQTVGPALELCRCDLF